MSAIVRRKKRAKASSGGKFSDVPNKIQKKVKSLFEIPIEKEYVEAATTYLRHQVNENKCQRCKCKAGICLPNSSMLQSFRLIGRNHHYITKELRKAILVNDWQSALKLALLFKKTGALRRTRLILRVCLVIIFNHPDATPEMLVDMIKGATGYLDQSDLDEVVFLLFTLRQKLMNVPSCGNFVRACSQRKFVTDRLRRESESDELSEMESLPLPSN